MSTAPVADPADITTLLSSLDSGFALPSSWYTDRQIFERELSSVLGSGWHFAAPADLLSPEAPYERDVAGQRVLFVTDHGGRSRGVRAACPHDGTAVSQVGSELSCASGQHGVSLSAEPAPARWTGSLSEVQVADWGCTVWVNLDPEAVGFDEWTAGLPELAASHGLQVEGLSFGCAREWTIEANWKVFLDNAIECYHCPTSHPALSRVLEMNPDLHVLTVGGRYWISHDVPFRRSSAEIADYYGIPNADRSAEARYHFHWIFPTTYFQYRVIGGAVQGFDIGTVDVVDVDRIRFRHLVFVPPGMSDEQLEQRRLRLEGDTTVPEDIQICGRVQRAHDAGVAPQGRLLPRSEWLLQHFQRVLVEDVAGRTEISA